jgi:hypothetical protein
VPDDRRPAGSVDYRIEVGQRARQDARVKTETGHTILLRDKLPPVKEKVMVVTDKFRCLGYRDLDGTWRHAQDGQGIENVQGWYGLEGKAENRPSASP